MPRNTPFGSGLPYSARLGGGVEHGEVLGMLLHHLAAEFERVLPGRMRHLVDEAFEIDGVLVVVHATPEARREVRVAHGVIDQDVRDVVADLAFGAAGVEPLEGRGIASVHEPIRRDAGEDRLAGDAHAQAGHVVVLVERRGELAHRDRMVGALGHVLFARPQQLDRHAGHLLGDLHRLRDVVGAGAPAEAAAGRHHGDLHLVERQARTPRPQRRAPPRRSASRSRPRTCRPCSARWR